MEFSVRPKSATNIKNYLSILFALQAAVSVQAWAAIQQQPRFHPFVLPVVMGNLKSTRWILMDENRLGPGHHALNSPVQAQEREQWIRVPVHCPADAQQACLQQIPMALPSTVDGIQAENIAQASGQMPCCGGYWMKYPVLELTSGDAVHYPGEVPLYKVHDRVYLDAMGGVVAGISLPGAPLMSTGGGAVVQGGRHVESQRTIPGLQNAHAAPLLSHPKNVKDVLSWADGDWIRWQNKLGVKAFAGFYMLRQRLSAVGDFMGEWEHEVEKISSTVYSVRVSLVGIAEASLSAGMYPIYRASKGVKALAGRELIFTFDFRHPIAQVAFNELLEGNTKKLLDFVTSVGLDGPYVAGLGPNGQPVLLPNPIDFKERAKFTSTGQTERARVRIPLLYTKSVEEYEMFTEKSIERSETGATDFRTRMSFHNTKDRYYMAHLPLQSQETRRYPSIRYPMYSDVVRDSHTQVLYLTKTDADGLIVTSKDAFWNWSFSKNISTRRDAVEGLVRLGQKSGMGFWTDQFISGFLPSFDELKSGKGSISARVRVHLKQGSLSSVLAKSAENPEFLVQEGEKFLRKYFENDRLNLCAKFNTSLSGSACQLKWKVKTNYLLRELAHKVREFNAHKGAMDLHTEQKSIGEILYMASQNPLVFLTFMSGSKTCVHYKLESEVAPPVSARQDIDWVIEQLLLPKA